MKILLNPENNIYDFNMNVIILHDILYASQILYHILHHIAFLVDISNFILLASICLLVTGKVPVPHSHCMGFIVLLYLTYNLSPEFEIVEYDQG